jgi:hypothetical protein
MAFDGAVAMESESGWSLQTATVKVSTVMMLAAVAVAMWIVSRCFSKMSGAKKAVDGGRGASYGAV